LLQGPQNALTRAGAPGGKGHGVTVISVIRKKKKGAGHLRQGRVLLGGQQKKRKRLRIKGPTAGPQPRTMVSVLSGAELTQ